MITLDLPTASATEDLGARLARVLRPGCIIYLCGDLGAGKTTLVRGLLRALGHTHAVKSPTYTLIEPYTPGDWQLIHCDLYRLGDPEELELIGLRDYLDGLTVLLVEWPEQGAGVLPAADVVLTLQATAAGRRCCIEATSTLGTTLTAAL